jgi:hypothetical protein
LWFLIYCFCGFFASLCAGEVRIELARGRRMLGILMKVFRLRLNFSELF